MGDFQMSMADEIEKLNQLRLSGAITEEEYQTSKSALLNGQQVADKKPNQVVVSTQMDEKTWAILLHLSQFCGFLIPLAGLVVPIVLWQVKKNESQLIDQHGRIVANWLVTAFIAGIVFFMLSFLLIGIPLLILLGVLCIVFPIVGAIKANDGIAWPYPGSYRFFPED
jgi:uncharacterized Tic20 family protein